MPASKGEALTWFPVVSWVLPNIRRSQKKDWTFIEKAIVGVNRNNENPSSSVKNSNSLNNNETGSRTTPRITGTGIRHFGTNLIGLKAQSTHYSEKPCVIIVPIMTVEEMRNWKGDAYSAIVLAGKWPARDTEEDSTATTSNDVYSDIKAYNGGTDSHFLASVGEIHTATELLIDVLCSLADACYPLDKNLFSNEYVHDGQFNIK